MTIHDLERSILEYVGRSNYRPVKPRGIAKQLNFSPDEYREVRRAVKNLVRQGKLKYGAGHLVEKATGAKSTRRDDGKEVLGVFRRTQAGFGFVRPQIDGRPGPRDRSEDIYIAASRTGDAASGDMVRVRIRRKRQGLDTQAAGEIVDIVERRTHQFVGRYIERTDGAFVEVDSNQFRYPIYVGDPGAKNAQVNDKVVIEVVRFPTSRRVGEGVITEVLGDHAAPGVDTLMVLREFELPEHFPEEVLEAARVEADQFDESITGDRRDLTPLTVITIDPVDARDFDDAISLDRLENGHWRLGVHIADVSHFVKPKSTLDIEARNRATSVYLPDRVIPMLPEVISNNLASLQPDRVRYTTSAFLEFTEEGVYVGVETCRGAIRSDRRFTYEEVDDFLENRGKWHQKLKPDVFRLLSDMHRLAMILRRRRLERGAIELSMPELKLELDKRGRVTGAHQVIHTESHQIIEEFMLAANEAVADLFQRESLHFLRRIHSNPDPRKLKQLTEFVRLLGFDVDSLESRFEIKRVLHEVEDKPEERAVNYAVLRAMQKAIYSPEEEGHYALASDAYCHFTSPIRRYPDLTVHRLLHGLLDGKKSPGDFQQLLMLGDHCSEREQRAEVAERELVKLKLLNYLNTRIGEELDAVITGVESYGVFAQGLELPAEGLIAVHSLEDDVYDLDDAAMCLVGRRRGNSFRLGDVIRVEIGNVDVDQRQLDLRYVKHIRRHAPPKSSRARNGKPTKKKPKSGGRKKSKRRKT